MKTIFIHTTTYLNNIIEIENGITTINGEATRYENIAQMLRNKKDTNGDGGKESLRFRDSV